MHEYSHTLGIFWYLYIDVLACFWMHSHTCIYRTVCILILLGGSIYICVYTSSHIHMNTVRWLYMDIYIYMYTCEQFQVPVYVHMHASSHIHMNTIRWLYMFICVIYMYTCEHCQVPVYVHMHTSSYVHMSTVRWLYIYICIYLSEYCQVTVYIHMYIFICMHVHIFRCLYMYICMHLITYILILSGNCICTYAYIYLHTCK